MARILHEQGRRQLEMGFGEPEFPNCRGLTIEELSRLDLSQINFSELFAELWQSYKPKTAHEATKDVTVDGIQGKMDAIQKGIKRVF